MALPFQQMLASSVPVIAAADPKRAGTGPEAVKKAALVETVGEAVGVVGQSVAGGRAGRRKKA